jgi:hypothetical protein
MAMPRIFTCQPKSEFYRNEEGLQKKFSESCDFSVYYHPFFEIKINDEVIFCGDHAPDEEWLIEKTGKKLADLSKADEAYFIGTNVCLNCFKTDHVGFHKGEKCTCEEPKFVSLSEMEGKTCPKCKVGIIKSSQTGIIT